ncbi:MAG: peptide chain release factor N(5)-glutamine methyltransferase [Gemmatimonadales bacterium]
MTQASATLRDLLDAGARRLAAAGLPDPRREAVRIWTGLDGRPPADRLLLRETEVDSRARTRFDLAVDRRLAGEPLAYVTGWTGFRHLDLRCDRRALIPRPETEGLVDLALECCPEGRAADIGTGTGCLALSLAFEGRYDAVLAVDRSAPALELAAENAHLTGQRVTFLNGDLSLALGPASLDLLVSNPPYLTRDEYAALDPAVRAWEPGPALVSGPDGLEATRRLLEDGLRVLRPGGWILLELDSTRAVPTAQLAAAAGWAAPQVRDDLFGRARYLIARRSQWK